MTTAEAVETILRQVGQGAVVVSSLGRTAEEVFRRHPSALFLDCLGAPTPVACGVALGASEVHTVCFDTDGSFLMDLSAILALHRTIELCGERLTLAVLDNGILESGGGDASRSCPLDWTGLLASVGIDAVLAGSASELRDALGRSPHPGVIIARVENLEPASGPEKSTDGRQSRDRFVEHLLALRGQTAAPRATKS